MTHRLRVERLEDRDVPTANFLAVGSEPGTSSTASLIDADSGVTRFTVNPFDVSASDGIAVNVAVGDVTGDRVPDLITAPGVGGGPIIKVFDGITGNEVRSFAVLDPNFRGGLSIATGDYNRDGITDIFAAAGPGGGPVVVVIDGKTGAIVSTFFAFDPAFRGGLHIAAGDVDGDGRADAIVSAGIGGGPHVKAFSLAFGNPPRELLSFFAYDAAFRGGTHLSSGDLDGDGITEIITGAGIGGGPHVLVFNPVTRLATASFFAGTTTERSGVQVAMRYPDQSATGIVCTKTPSSLKEFTPATWTEIPPAFDTGNRLPAGTSHAVLNAAQLWANFSLQLLKEQSFPPTRAARATGMVGAAIYDAANSIQGGYTPYRISVPAIPEASPEAAIAAAAHDVLVNLFPTRAADIAAVRNGQLALIGDVMARSAGEAVGTAVAADLLAWRGTDGSTTVVPYTPGNQPGDYQLTPPQFAPALNPNWPYVTPFTMTSGDQFRPGPPPSLDSVEYADNLNYVKAIGGMISSIRTEEQALIGHFWADVPGFSPAPPGHWFQIGVDQSVQHQLNLMDSARLIGMLGVALADASIVSWDAKYFYDLWRPVTAIRAADTDGNPLTEADPTWSALWDSPPFSAYTSGHSTFSGAASTVLTALLGDNLPFRTSSVDVPGVSRSFASFRDAAEEAGMSRVYGGIHFLFDNTAGLSSGRALGEYIADNFMQPPGP